MQKLNLPIYVKATGEEGEYHTFEGLVAAYGNVDLGGDRIEKGAFADFLRESANKGQENVPILWAHRHGEPIGIMPISEMSETDKGLWVKGYMPKSDTFVSGRVMPQMQIGSVRTMSIGYDCDDWTIENNIRVLNKLYLFEGSLTPLPMNPDATITSFKEIVPYADLPLADRSRPWDSDAALGRVREWSGIDTQNDLLDPDAQRKYKRAFLWFDGADQASFDAYKLPFADIIDGQLTAVPRGIFTAAGVMRGAYGGAYLPQQDRPSIKRNIERYYEKMGLETPFGKSFRIDDFSAIEIRDLEKVFRSGARFSAKMAVKLVSAIKAAGLRDVESDGARDEKDTVDDELNNKIDELLTLFNN